MVAPKTALKRRELLKSVYPGAKWAEKVDRWTDTQVFAVLMRLKQQNKV